MSETKKILEEAYSLGEKMVDAHIKKWTDLDNWLTGVYETAMVHFAQTDAYVCVLVQRAYIAALQDLPEEGDCTVVAKRMFKYMTVDSHRLVPARARESFGLVSSGS